jgi:CDP-glucose 4,6-dehydratase
MIEQKYWQGKNVFVTGVNGFIGGHLAHALLKQGARVTGLIRNLKADTYLHYEGLAEKCNLVIGDLTSRELMERIVSEEQIQVVFHLGAQVEVGVARKFPYLTWETNVKGTYCLLEALRTHREQLEAVIVASSDKAYGVYPATMMPYREDYPLKPTFPYDVSKACADMIAQSYASELFQVPLVITRFCNIYGPGQLNFSAVIPDATRSAFGYSEFVPRSDGRHVRDFIYAEDVAHLYLVIAQSLAKNPKLAGEVFNAGTNQPKEVRDVVKKVYDIVGNQKAYDKVAQLFNGRQTSGEIDCQFMSFDKVNQYFGWKPQTEFDQGLKKTVDWFRKYLSNTEMKAAVISPNASTSSTSKSASEIVQG